MKSKSYVTDGPLLIAQQRDLKFGEVLAESYWQIKNGIYKASEPDTSEILANWFYNGFLHIEDNKIYLLNWYTGCCIDYYKQPDNVNVEKIVFQPDESSNDDKVMIEAIEKTKNDYLIRFATKPFLIK